MIKRWFWVLFILTGMGSSFAGVTGKVAGRIIDTQTRQGIPGVNVMLENTTIGAMTDVNGNYVILNVPPGNYTVRASIVGYKAMRVENVRVSIDLTTTVNFNLTPTVLDMEESITVVAQRPMIQKDEVATKHFVSSDEIILQPVDSFQEIARNQAGVVGDHFRGGRSGEVLVLIDGIAVRDPSAEYSGGLGGFTSDVPKESIQEMEVSLGGFSAEYGNVQSGVINLAMKEGSKKYSGRVRMTSTDFGSDKINTPLLKNIYEMSLSGPEPLTSTLLPMIGVKLPGSLTFSLSGELTDQDHGYYPNQMSLEKTLQSKLTYRITPNHKLILGALNNRRDWDEYYFWAAKYGPTKEYQFNEYKRVKGSILEHFIYVTNPQDYYELQGQTRYEPGEFAEQKYDSVRTYYSGGMLDYLWNYRKKSDMVYAIWTHALSPKTYYEVRLQNFYTNYHYSTADVDDRDRDGNTKEDLVWDHTKPGPHPIVMEREKNLWWVRGDDPGFRTQTSLTNSVKMDLVSQVTHNHLLKAGVEFYHHRTKVENISWSLGNVTSPRKDIWNRDAYDLGAFIQDKLEFQGIIALIGLRYDLFNPNGLGEAVIFPADYSQPYSTLDEQGFPVFINGKKPTVKQKLSPRIGISHPITDRDVIHYTYGHYFQRPDLYFLYRNYRFQDLTKVGNYIGNPDLRPEKTVAYEIGLEHQFTNDFKLSVTGYYKDVSDLMNWNKYVGRTIQNIELNVFTNADYGNIKGMELSLYKRVGRFWGGSVNYTYSVAKGRSSNAYGGAGSFTDAKRMNILDFDQTHTVNANLTFRTPRDFNIRPLANWQTNIQFAYGSGLPYTSFGSTIVNDKRLPWTSTTDLKLLRQINISKINLDLFIDVINVFDRKNVRWIGSSLYYEVTGDPSILMEDMTTGTFIRNKQVYDYGRQVRFGVALQF